MADNMTVPSTATPAALGYRMPAEWEPHEATWLAWPHNRETWFAQTPAIPRIYAQIVRALMGGEKVRLLVPDEAARGEAEDTLRHHDAWGDNVELHVVPTNDAWARDFGPLFVVKEEDGQRRVALTNWKFNSWGGKYPYDLDDAVPEYVRARYGFRAWQPGIVMEGGSIDVNGRGTLLTTESCLLNPNRNPGLSPAEIEEHLRAYLGVQRILWLGDGIAGDDTDGHVDDISRFVNPTTVVTAIEDNPADENYNVLQYNLGRLLGMRDQDNRPLTVVTIPMPEPVEYDGQRLPASYANFYIGNRAVLVPIFQCAEDRRALTIFQELFPDRRIVGIDCRELVIGLGGIHCITQQQPAGAPG